ncbi:hypothetical protein D9Q98_009097 [Chlorella vulgaris]|uniref:Chalcone isomerase domain-containing protein n=1 Tax=Chlorella vulgaris TaxID=3077 RepID=A0A9D4YTH5_CHLVU|nr:hypothetical protein D9Q98_009097 [Chlorella vulgaris]
MADSMKDSVTGISFPLKQQFWHGGMMTCIGVGARVKKVAMMTAKVYAASMYIEEGPATLAVRQHSQPDSDAAAAEALTGGAFTKVLQMHLVRSITGKQFTDALDENLRPVLGGNAAVMDEFCGFFGDKKLEQGTEISLMWKQEGPVDVALRVEGDKSPYSGFQPGVTIQSPCLGPALWGLYLSPNKPPAPDARKMWLAGLRRLGRGGS